MPVYTIGTPDGRKIRIDAPDEQTAIRGAQEYVSANPKPGVVTNPSDAYQQANAAASRASQQLKGVVPKKADMGRQSPDFLTSTAATIAGLTSSVPFLNNISDAVVGAGAQLMGGDYGQTVGNLQQRRANLQQQAPVAYGAGNVAGYVAPYAAATKIPTLASALGMSGTLPARIGNSAMSGAALSAADAASQGGSPEDIGGSGAIGGAVGGAIPAAGEALKWGAGAFLRPAAQTLRGMVNPEGQAAKAVGNAILRDRAVPGATMTPADEAAARMNGQPILNVDRGGEVTRGLMRSAANQNPEARGIVTRMADDRFATQAPRATQFFNRIMGGQVDDLARKAEIDAAAREANDPAYRAAMDAPYAQDVWTRELYDLMQSPTFRGAVKSAERRSSDVAATQGQKAVVNPFVFGSDGSVSLKDGVRPTLRFWDQVKRNLDGMIGTAKRQGDNTRVSDLMGLKRKLVETLDTMVPQYAKARGTAMTFFQAENAVDAGRKAFAAPRQIDESLKAFRSMTPAQKKDFGIGMVSQAMDEIRAGNNRSNMTRMFDSEARKALMQEALGPGKYRQFEAFVRVENLMDQVRGALGNSTTTRQLMELGIMGGLAGGSAGVSMYTGGTPTTAVAIGLMVGAGRMGMRALGKKVNDNVMQNVARLLASGSEADLQKAIANAALSQQHMEALKAIEAGLGAAMRGASRVAIAAQ